ncbi:MAG: 3-hydroxyacyl-[acyl-carrier-protein] dehydratase FabZ [Spirochaetes bacterium GWF1_41_5]|nr:MAG: 3-hydroxyacyl-[acyl-carrier-protein] dehydratase FabZ [Spirochaetes bacterium GWF1_41_5]HBE02602.1 3-hydroxyacyl-[acyl-carrier-protein] dehydratase FabZ [Spirochaetia bacterium]
MDIKKIKDLLPHRYPFLLVDKVLEMRDRYIETLKNVTINEPFFQGHFPHEPIMPGVLIIEAMAQSGGIYAMHKNNLDSSRSVYFMMIDRVKFRQPVRPGDQLIMKITMLKESVKMLKMSAEAWVGDKKACEAELVAMVADAPAQ